MDQNEPSVVYDAGERRRHDQHATEAYDFASRAESLLQMAENSTALSVSQRYIVAGERTMARAQWHATMAVYEALVLPGYGMSIGDQLEHEREGGTR